MIANDQRRADVKRALSDPWRLAELLGLTEGAKRQGSGLSVRCPSHGENNPSCSITAAPDGGIRVKCFACDFSGDALTLVAVVRGLDVGRDFPAVLAEAEKLAGIDGPAPPPVRRPQLAAVPAAAPDLGAEWAALEPVGPEAWDYLRGRGLEEAADFCRTAPSHGPLAACAAGIAVALRDQAGRIVAIQARNLGEGKAHDFRVWGSAGSGCFGEPHRVAEVATVVVCEGLTDTLAAQLSFAAGKSLAVVGIAGVAAKDQLLALPWKGRRALIATDADDAGDTAAKAIAEAIEKQGGRPIRLRPERHKDLAAMRAAGVDLLAFARTAASRSQGFQSFATRIEGEREKRMADAGRALSWGITFLDVITGGIVPRDNILLGAESGMGKTEAATIAALTNAAAGKRVHYFALEPEHLEVERRIKFKYLARVVGAMGINIDFQDWSQGKIDRITGPHEAAADRALAAMYANLHTFYRSERKGPFTAADFDRMARAVTDETDLIILDHVHYFDEGDDTNRSQKRAAMEIRDLAIQTGRPVIQIAHLRKMKSSQVRKAPRLVPERDDFEGSSHLFKPVKRAILLAPAFGAKKSVPWVWPTYIALVKNTYGQVRCRYVGMVGFNARHNAYEEGFVLGTLQKNGEQFAPVAREDLPPWARYEEPQQEMPTATDEEEEA